MSFVNEIDDVVYILTVLSFVMSIGLYHHHFIILAIVRFCYIRYIIYYVVNTQFSLVAASFLQNIGTLNVHELF